MAIEVRIPTILRNYTGGSKSVEGSGSTLADLIADLDSRHSGLAERLVDDGALRRFVNVYLNDEDVRFLGGLDAPVKDGDTVTVLPAVSRRDGLTGPACATTRCWTHSAGRRLSACRGCRQAPRPGCGPSWRTGTQPAR